MSDFLNSLNYLFLTPIHNFVFHFHCLEKPIKIVWYLLKSSLVLKYEDV